MKNAQSSAVEPKGLMMRTLIRLCENWRAARSGHKINMREAGTILHAVLNGIYTDDQSIALQSEAQSSAEGGLREELEWLFAHVERTDDESGEWQTRRRALMERLSSPAQASAEGGLREALSWIENWFRMNIDGGGNHACPWCYKHTDSDVNDSWKTIEHSPDCLIGKALAAQPTAQTPDPDVMCPRCEGQKYDKGTCSLCGNTGRIKQGSDQAKDGPPEQARRWKAVHPQAKRSPENEGKPFDTCPTCGGPVVALVDGQPAAIVAPTAPRERVSRCKGCDDLVPFNLIEKGNVHWRYDDRTSVGKWCGPVESDKNS
jgi:hypothetical protein